MIQIENIGNEGFQEHTIPLPNGDILLSLKFLSSVQFWQMSVTYNDKAVNGVKLSCGVMHMRSRNFPFDFIVEDTSAAGLDPYKAEDFTTGRVVMYLIEPAEMAEIRGQIVE